jgi:CRP-like cAMP-binding protein
LQQADLALIRRGLEALAHVEDDVWATVVPLIRSVRLSKGDHFLRAGERARSFGWVLKGIMRKYYIDAQGREHSTGFFVEAGYPFGSLPDLTSGAPSQAYLDCLEDVEAGIVDWEDFQALCQREPRWNIVMREAGERFVEMGRQRELELLTLDAEARYHLALERARDIVNRIPLYHFASYLGIRPEHLSRIRRKNVK